MKAILVIDMPKDCEGCPLHHFVLDEVLNEWFVSCQLDTFIDEDGKRPSKCPLRPMPQKKVPYFDPNANTYDEEREKTIMYEIDGYNRCIDELEEKQNNGKEKLL